MNLLHRIGRPDLIDADFIDMYRILPGAILDHLEYITGEPGWDIDDNEASIMSNEESDFNDFYTFEFITPITDYETQVRVLRSMFAFMWDSSLQTNDTCGLHVNVSYDGIETLPYDSVLNSIPENEILSMFNRTDNKFCMPWGKMNVSELYDAVRQSTVEDTKTCSINFKKLEKGYIEFRMIGGVDYHRNDAVYTAIDMIISGMENEFENRRISGT